MGQRSVEFKALESARWKCAVCWEWASERIVRRTGEAGFQSSCWQIMGDQTG